MAVGRPSIWDDRFIALAYGQSLLGKTNAQLAVVLGVGLATLKRWMKDRPPFRAAIARGKAEADGHVVGALFQACVGFMKDVEVVKILGNGQIVRTTTTKYFPPDPRAQEVWLRNRVRELWAAGSDRVPEHEVQDAARELRQHLMAMDALDGVPTMLALQVAPTVEVVGTTYVDA